MTITPAASCSKAGGIVASQRAFTLIEVLIAITLFFVSVFAILDLVMVNVRAAHKLNQMGPTAGMVAAELSMTNRLEEGTFSGDFEIYPDYSWEQNITMFETNGLFQVDILVLRKGNEDSRLSILLYRPDSQQRVGDGAGQRQFNQPGGRESGADKRRQF